MKIPFLERFMARVRSWFHKGTPIVMDATPVGETLQAPVAVPEQPKKPRKPRTSHKEERRNLSELLDNLDASFDTYRLPSLKESWLAQDSVIGLRKLGTHVPNPWAMVWSDDEEKIKVDVSKAMPTLMCICIGNKETRQNSEADTIYPDLMFAIKHNKLPWYVGYHSGVPYQFGAAFRLEGKLFWIHMWFTINRKTGAMQACEELRTVTNVIPIKNPASKRAGGGKSHVITKRAWSQPSFFENDKRSVEHMRLGSKNIFASMFNWWVKREERWNVVVKKNGERVTFGVDQDQTRFYFKDRDKSVKTASGQTQRIVHYVKEHDRVINGKSVTIKEHIRGLREFSWAGYQCLVTSPKITGSTSATFDSAGVEGNDADKTEFVYLSKLGKLLAQAEEKDRRAA
jgi:hypothetical protein